VAGELGDHASVVSADLSPESLVAIYGGARMTLACRLHSAIFSLVAGTKAVVVSLDGRKSEGVYASLGLPAEWVVTQNPHDLARLPRMVEDMLDEAGWGRDVLRMHVSRATSALEPLPALMEAAITNSPRNVATTLSPPHDE
jgi:polysaccharide pyruvyl transferase WcaK-like protein